MELEEVRAKTKRIPVADNREEDYSEEFIQKRIQFILDETGAEITHIPQLSFKPRKMIGNIENVIGCAQIPIGIVGPLKVNGEQANGEFFVPIATTEGALLTGLQNGVKLLTLAGGVNTKVLRDVMHVSPIFFIYGLKEATAFINWLEKNINVLKLEVKKVTRYGELLSIEPKITGEGVITTMFFSTGDASGMNMTSLATFTICKYIDEVWKIGFYIRSNFSSEKKQSEFNFFSGYGKEVFAEATLPKELLELKNLRVTWEQISKYCAISYHSSFRAGMHGTNCHVGNIIAGIFAATGQDLAHITHSNTALTYYRLQDNGDLYVSVYIPNLVIGTVGGGTGLPTQRECLEIMGCKGNGKALKLAEIIAAASLAAEMSILIGLTNFSHVQVHEKLGRNKPEE
ncbi:MAG: hydroxymethylglutaryl-CoA reductase [Candidatus Lokiarchaeota archaeon]|nr:hydroxymethylglutaryl-CoA reductase [Candidatus Lokiarchaeota archaeon]